jgi:hypothetical protein
MRKISSFFICLLAGALSYGAEVSIGIEPASITLDDSAVLSIKVRGAKNPPQPSNPRIPQCLTAQATTMRNADETIFRFRIYPAQAGDIQIGPIEYEVDGQISRLTANLQVLEGPKQNAPINNPRSSMKPADREANNVASEFIRGNTPVASNLVVKALNRYPEDEKLQKLKKLIEEQQQKQDQQKQDQQNKDQNRQDQKQDQKQDQQKQQSGQDDKKNQQQDQQKEQGQNQPDQADQKQGQDQQQPAQPKQAGEMSKEEAQQLLDAMKQDEQDQRTNLKPFLGGPVRVEKDW